MTKESQKTIVSSWNEWDPLKHIIIGKADYCCIPWEEPALDAKVPEDSEMKGMHGPRPQATVEKANAQLDNLATILEQRGVRVDRPTPIQWNRSIGTPDWQVNSMFGCMPARDVLLTVGKEIIEATMSYRCRWFEYLAYRPLLKQYFADDPEMRWEAAPKPCLTDVDYKEDYLNDKITIEQRLKWTAEKNFVTTEHEPLFDAADVCRMGKDLFVQHGFTTNLKAMDWLQRHFPTHRVHGVNFPGDPYPIHIDATFVPLRPGLCINNPHRRLPDDQKKIFEKNGWEIIDAAQPAHKKPPPLCYSSVWLAMNCLVIDPKTVCIEASEVHMLEQMDALGFEVIPVPFRDAYPFGGGLHCSSADVYREGNCEDYFPNQIEGF